MYVCAHVHACVLVCVGLRAHAHAHTYMPAQYLHLICSYSSVYVDTVCVQLINETLTVRTYFIIYLLLPALALKRAICIAQQ